MHVAAARAAALSTIFVLALSSCRVAGRATEIVEATCADRTRLICTGLYGPEAHAGERRIAAGIAGYEPGFRLWSDGLDKARYVYLPPGTRIDTSDMNEWRFPIGTKLWKQFSWRGRRIETRFFEKTAPETWRATTFVWNADQSDAREQLDGKTVQLDGGHGAYEIPGQCDCERCHGGRSDHVLGFEALALAAPGAKGLTLTRLAAEGRLTRVPPPAATVLPGGPLDQAALGWLHMNCGVSCHNPNPAAGASFAGLDLKLTADGARDPRATATVRTAVNRPTTTLGFKAPDAPKIRITPGHPRASAIYFRASARTPALSMPPLATHLVDREALDTLDRWIVALAGSADGQATPRRAGQVSEERAQ